MAKLSEGGRAMLILFAGEGSDAPGWGWGPNGPVPTPGWGPDLVAELSHAVTILREAAQLKDAGVAMAHAARGTVLWPVYELAQKQIAEYMQEGGVLVLG